jgi:hemolysin III
MAWRRKKKSWITGEELANSITHAAGFALSMAGFVMLIYLAATRGTARHIVSCAIYGATLISVYAASTLYHAIPSARAKRVLRILDHSAIYLLIAGTYTPFLLINLRGAWGWSLFGVIWGLAAAGIVLKVWFVEHFAILSTVIYIAMGWLAVIAAKPLLAAIPRNGIAWLLAGGVMYTAGVVFYASKRIRFGHVIWHVFVMAGSACHYVAVLLVVLPRMNR